MRKLLTLTCYGSVFLTYSFLTLPFLLPNNIAELNTSTSYDVIVVLGGGVAPDCQLFDSMQARMDAAIHLLEQKKSTKLILSGGAPGGNFQCLESEAMRQYALTQNVADEIIIKESESLNTYQNAYNTVQIMKLRGLKKALIVTTDFHIKRANVIFNEYNIEHQMIVANNKTTGSMLYTQLFREQLLLCFHAVLGIPNQFGLHLKEQKMAAVLKSLVSS